MNSFDADGYTFTYFLSRGDVPCHVNACGAAASIDVTRKAGGEVQTYCPQHARSMFPKYREDFKKLMFPVKSAFDNKKELYPYSMGCRMDPPPCSICDSTHSIFNDFTPSVEYQRVLDTPADTAARIVSQRRTDPVYDKPDDPFEGDSILEARVVQHLSGKHGNEILTKVIKRMIDRNPGMASKYLFRFLPNLGRMRKQVHADFERFESMRKK